MRYYFISHEGEEGKVDLLKATRTHEREVEASFNGETIYVRRLAGRYFISHDRISWRKTPPINLDKEILISTKHYHLFRGYKPSGIGAGSEGELLTQMPGKVVKIFVREGDSVTKGQTLLILEAMKMENEIKSSLDGVVKAIHAKEGLAVEHGFMLLEIEA